MNKLIEHSHKDDIGKNYFARALLFAFNSEFGKAYEFFKLGLDILTCDCQGGWLKTNSETNKKVFDDITVKHIPHFEYYFVKAFIMSYEEDKKGQYLALEAIDKYIEVKNDEYGNYVKGKILLALNENQQAFDFFKNATLGGTNPRLLYRLGRTKEQCFEQRGLNELYYSFIQNPSSACCARILRKYLKQRGYQLVLDENETNPLLIAFNNDEDEWEFQNFYEKCLKRQLKYDNFIEVDKAEIVNSFVRGIINSSYLFIEEDNDDVDDDYYDQSDDDSYASQYFGQYAGSYAQDVKGLSDDFINDVLDGDPDAYWNID